MKKTEIKNAKWLNMYYWWTCSNCYYAQEYIKPKVCPRCKAKMENWR